MLIMEGFLTSFSWFQPTRGPRQTLFKSFSFYFRFHQYIKLPKNLTPRRTWHRGVRIIGTENPYFLILKITRDRCVLFTNERIDLIIPLKATTDLHSFCILTPRCPAHFWVWLRDVNLALQCHAHCTRWSFLIFEYLSEIVMVFKNISICLSEPQLRCMDEKNEDPKSRNTFSWIKLLGNEHLCSTRGTLVQHKRNTCAAQEEQHSNTHRKRLLFSKKLLHSKRRFLSMWVSIGSLFDVHVAAVAVSCDPQLFWSTAVCNRGWILSWQLFGNTVVRCFEPRLSADLNLCSQQLAVLKLCYSICCVEPQAGMSAVPGAPSVSCHMLSYWSVSCHMLSYWSVSFHLFALLVISWLSDAHPPVR